MSLDIKELKKKLYEDPSILDDLQEDQLKELRAELNPYGTIASSNTVYANLSIINWKDRFFREFYTTSLAAFLSRKVKDYQPFRQLGGAELTDEQKAETEKIKSTISEFLNKLFLYDPDKHVRVAHRGETPDSEEIKKKLTESAERESRLSQTMKDKSTAVYNYLRSNTLYAYQNLQQAAELLEANCKLKQRTDLSEADMQGILLKNTAAIRAVTDDLAKLAGPLSASETLPAAESNIPAEFFAEFDRYTKDNYEYLRDICSALYGNKEDFEYSVYLYDTFNTLQQAEEHMKLYRDDFRQEPITVQSGAVTLLGPFKENREKLRFYSSNTQLLAQMQEMVESEQKLGADMVKKQVKALKKKNIEQAGPDARGLSDYVAKTDAASFGVKPLLTREEREKIEEEVRKREDKEVPAGAIQTDIYKPQENEDGEVVGLARSKLYTQAEAPLHLQEGSPFAASYQPVRDINIPIEKSLMTTTAITEQGKKVQVSVPKDYKPT